MPITKLLTGLPNQSMPQDVFDQSVGLLFADWPTWNLEVNALEANVNAKEVLVNAAAASLITKADEAIDAAADAAQAAATAQAAADTSVNAAAGFLASSTSTNTVGTGLKTYAIGSNKSFFRGMFVIVVSASNMAVYSTGQVDSYSNGNLIVNGKAVGSPGATANDWIIGPSGSQGAAGPIGGLAGANLTGALNAARAPDLASASTIDPWSGAGNFVVLTGSGIIVTFGPAPQAGVARDLLVAGNPVLFASSTILIRGVKSGRPLLLAPGDRLELVAETTTITRITVTRADGSSPCDRARTHSALLSF